MLSVCRVLLLLSPSDRHEAVQLLRLNVQPADDGGLPKVHSLFPLPGCRLMAFSLSIAEQVSVWLSGVDESAGVEWAASMRALFPLSRAFGVQSAHTNGEAAAGDAEGSSGQLANGVVHTSDT